MESGGDRPGADAGGSECWDGDLVVGRTASSRRVTEPSLSVTVNLPVTVSLCPSFVPSCASRAPTRAVTYLHDRLALGDVRCAMADGMGWDRLHRMRALFQLSDAHCESEHDMSPNTRARARKRPGDLQHVQQHSKLCIDLA